MKNFLNSPNSYTSTIKDSLFNNPGNLEYTLLSSNKLQWSPDSINSRLLNNNNQMPISHIPLASNNPIFSLKSFDFIKKGNEDITPFMLRSKEESAPNHVFNTYWLSY